MTDYLFFMILWKHPWSGIGLPNGKLLLLEHMRPGNVLLGLLFDMVNPMVVRMMGANINRRTMGNIEKAGWQILKEEHLSGDIVRWIEAKPTSSELKL